MPALFVRRERWTLTLSGWLLFLLAMTGALIAVGRYLCVFLALNSPVKGRFLVVEGWLPSYAYREAVARFHDGAYEKIIAAGVFQDAADPADDTGPCYGDKELVRFGAPADRVVIAAAAKVERDRTFHAAMAVKQWLEKRGVDKAAVDVVSIGPHARRSRLLFQRALGPAMEVGVIAIVDRRFDEEHWWRSSAGVRTVIGETIAYAYARVFAEN